MSSGSSEDVVVGEDISELAVSVINVLVSALAVDVISIIDVLVSPSSVDIFDSISTGVIDEDEAVEVSRIWIAVVLDRLDVVVVVVGELETGRFANVSENDVDVDVDETATPSLVPLHVARSNELCSLAQTIIQYCYIDTTYGNRVLSSKTGFHRTVQNSNMSSMRLNLKCLALYKNIKHSSLSKAQVINVITKSRWLVRGVSRNRGRKSSKYMRHFISNSINL